MVFDDTTVEVFAYRQLIESEARREVAELLREDRQLERGVTHQVFSPLGLEEPYEVRDCTVPSGSRP